MIRGLRRFHTMLFGYCKGYIKGFLIGFWIGRGGFP
jgi:hypothetical protein